MSKLKALANDKLNVARMLISVFDWLEDVVEKGEMLVLFSLAPTVF